MKKKLTGQKIVGLVFTVLGIVFLGATMYLISMIRHLGIWGEVFLFFPMYASLLLALVFVPLSIILLIGKEGIRRLWIIPTVAYALIIATINPLTVSTYYKVNDEIVQRNDPNQMVNLSTTLRDIYNCPSNTLNTIDNDQTRSGIDDTKVFGNYLNDLVLSEIKDNPSTAYQSSRYITLIATTTKENRNASLMMSELGYIRFTRGEKTATYEYSKSEFDHMYTIANALIEANPIE